MTVRPQPILYMPMEIASRELDSRLLLASLAIARGYEVVIGQKWLLERNIAAMPPGLYLSKTLTARDGIAMAAAKRRGYAVAAIDEELPGLVMSADQLRWMSPDAVAATDLIFVAGAGNAAAIAGRFPTAANRIVQAANPRWDMLRAQLRGYYDEDVADLRQRFGRFILINTNLGFINSEKGSAEQIIRDQERLGKLDMKNPEHKAYVTSIIDMEDANRQVIEELLVELPQHFPDHQIVLRPHPSESIATWTKIVNGRKGIEVLREGSAVAWIRAGEILIHTNCTTGVESLALDQPAICVLPSDSTANGRYLSNRVNPIARNTAETIALVAATLNHVNGARVELPYTEDMQNDFRNSMSHDAAKLGAETILDAIGGLVPSDAATVKSGETISAWQPGWRYRWKLQDKNVRGTLMPDLDMADVTARLRRFAALLNIAPPAVIEDAGTKVLLLGNRSMSRGTALRRCIGRVL